MTKIDFEPINEVERRAVTAMAAIVHLAELDTAFAAAFMMQGAITLSCDSGMTQDDIAKSFAAAMKAFDRALKQMAQDTRGLTAH